VRDALAFLDGSDLSPLTALERAMTAASAALLFERAAALRDKLEVLQWLNAHLERVRAAARQSFVYAVPSHEGPELWYLIDQGRVRAVAPWDEARAALTAVYGKRRERTAPPMAEEIDEILLVAAWFRRHAAERERTVTPEQALRES
jgi:excinuclease UvrABC nuclease subunit